MPNVVKVRVENSDEILNTGAYGAGALVRLQSSATETGAFVDVTGTGSTPTLPIVAGTRIYTGYDPAGAVSTWYRTRYESADTLRLSDWTAAFQVGAEEGGLICSLYDVKFRLGISATDTTKDEFLLETIGRVGTGIMGYTERRFVRNPSSGTTAFLFDVECPGTVLRVPQGIAEASQLEVATTSQPESGGTYDIVPAADWFLRPLASRRTFGWPATEIVITDLPSGEITSFSTGYNAARVTMAEGFAAVPGDIAGIAEDEVIRRYQGRGQGYTAAESGEGFIRLLRANAPDDAKRLEWYRVGRAG